jgi:hypothetical protein
MSIKFDEIYFPTIIYIKFVSGRSYLNGAIDIQNLYPPDNKLDIDLSAFF